MAGRVLCVVAVTMLLMTNPVVAGQDSDGDGLSDEQEKEKNWNPDNPDMDGDGLHDGEEVNDYLTDPEDADSDSDGIADGEEVERGSDPTKSDKKNSNSGEQLDDIHTRTIPLPWWVLIAIAIVAIVGLYKLSR